MSKKSTSIVLVLVILLSGILAIPTYAGTPLFDEENPVIKPAWSYASTCKVGLNSSGKTLYPTVNIQAKSDNYKISGTLYLESKSGSTWKTVTSWNISSTGQLKDEKTYTGSAGVTYRTRVAATVNGESVTATSSSKTL